MNFKEITTRIQERTGDTKASFWTRAQILRAVNEGLEDFCHQTLSLYGPNELTPKAKAEGSNLFDHIELPANTIRPLRFEYRGKNLPRLEENLLDLYYSDWKNNAQDNYPAIEGVLLNTAPARNVRIYPVMSDANEVPVWSSDKVVAWTARTALALALDTDTPEIPEVYHRALVYYALARGYEKDSDEGSFSKADYFRGLYQAIVDRAKEDMIAMFGSEIYTHEQAGTDAANQN